MSSNTVQTDRIEQNMVINSVKSFQKVQEDSSSRLSVIHGRRIMPYTLKDFYEIKTDCYKEDYDLLSIYRYDYKPLFRKV